MHAALSNQKGKDGYGRKYPAGFFTAPPEGDPEEGDSSGCGGDRGSSGRGGNQGAVFSDEGLTALTERTTYGSLSTTIEGTGTKLATLVDDSKMTLTQYFSYAYEDQIYVV